jgi:hypothetical protein
MIKPCKLKMISEVEDSFRKHIGEIFTAYMDKDECAIDVTNIPELLGYPPEHYGRPYAGNIPSDIKIRVRFLSNYQILDACGNCRNRCRRVEGKCGLYEEV